MEPLPANAGLHCKQAPLKKVSSLVYNLTWPNPQLLLTNHSLERNKRKDGLNMIQSASFDESFIFAYFLGTCEHQLLQRIAKLLQRFLNY